MSDPDTQSGFAPPEPAAIPEHMVVLLLEAGQRFLEEAGKAIDCQDQVCRDRCTRKVLAILEELHRRLDHDQGGELVANLVRLYEWWGWEVVTASAQNDLPRLNQVCKQMGDIRKSWEHILFQGEGLTGNPDF